MGEEITKPSILRKATSAKLIDSLLFGRSFNTAKYQKNNCSRRGILRKISTYIEATRLRSQLSESLEIAIKKPNIVDKNIAVTDNRIVFKIQTTIASP
jgi:hypothetical protein